MLAKTATSCPPLERAIEGVHAYFELALEPRPPGEARRHAMAAWVHVWGVVERLDRAASLRAACFGVVQDLERIAHGLAAGIRWEPPPELLPFRVALYDSRRNPGKDEVRVTLRFVLSSGEADLRASVRAAAKAIGLAEDRWRAAAEVRAA